MYYPGLEGKNVLLIGGHSNLGQHVTQLFAEAGDEFKSLEKHLAAEIPLQRLGEPADVAHAVLYLASPVTGGFQTGQVIGVDGGWRMPK